MDGLIKRGGVWIFRRTVPAHLRPILGLREVKRSLGTSDEATAQRRWRKVKADVDQMFAEAEKGSSPAVAAYKAVRDYKPGDERQEEGLDAHLTSLLEDGKLDPVRRAMVEGLLRRHEQSSEDNPPISILFARYFAERKPLPKTKLEWERVLDRFTKICGDLPVRSISIATVRNFKDALLSTTGGRLGTTLSPATVMKLLAALSSVLKWGKRNGYLTVDPSEGMTSLAGRNHRDSTNGNGGRLPYDAADLAKLFSKEALETRRNLWLARGRPADYWLPFLGLYQGARLEELGQLRVTDVRHEDGVDYLAIEPGDGKRVKTKSSRRRVPLHPELVRLGFLTFVEEQRAAGHVRLFPDLRATSPGVAVTAAWSKAYGRHARKLGITDTRKVFHSFRHGWKDAARACMSEDHHDAITGHANGSVGRSYGLGVPLNVLAESMAKVRYSGLNATQ